MLKINMLVAVLLITLPLSLLAQNNHKLAPSLNDRIAQNDRSTELVKVLIKGDVDQIRHEVEQLGGSYRFSTSRIAAVTVPLDKMNALSKSNSVRYIDDLKGKLIKLNDQMVINNGITPVHQGSPPLQTSYTGDGVVVGVMDTGIEIDHPDFKNSDGTTRIKYIWDQNAFGNPPAGYTYGYEWTATDIDAGTCTHLDVGGHGTNVTGIAAGNGSAVNNYKGVAPEADLVIVALDFGQLFLNNVLEAAEYIYAKAGSLAKPCVINASVGTLLYGSWDGRDLLSQMISDLITDQDGRAWVNAAGNSGDREFHLGYDVTQDTVFTWFKYMDDVLGNPNDDGVIFTMYADTGTIEDMRFSIGVDQQTPSYSFRGATSFRSVTDVLNQSPVLDTIYNNLNRIGYMELECSLINDSSTYELKVSITLDSVDYYWRFTTTGEGTFDIWSGSNSGFEHL
ncbi:MAG: S8 family serine peptidase [Bacteroidetes bacterium]|nr:S8 family serine peptidase [Bacteroidota bacterium]